MTPNLKVPGDPKTTEGNISVAKPRIGVIGVGGGGGNAVNNMIRSKLAGVAFMATNTDVQALTTSRADHRLQLGPNATGGLGAGANVEVGRAAAEEMVDDIRKLVGGYNMLFITAGMGGGTGTGAAPIIAKAAREQLVLTVGVVTTPFDFEGAQRRHTADAGLEELEQNVDSLIVIPNQNLFRITNTDTTFANAFNIADDVLYFAVRGITDLILVPGLINLDFADVRTVVSVAGRAMIGTGEAGGERRALDAAEAAIANPLLDIPSIKGARGVLINISGGGDMTLFEVDEAVNRIRADIDAESLIIFGSAFDDGLGDKIRVSVVATGLLPPAEAMMTPPPPLRTGKAAKKPPALAAEEPPQLPESVRETSPPPEAESTETGQREPPPAKPIAAAPAAGEETPAAVGETETGAARDNADPFTTAAEASFDAGVSEPADHNRGKNFLQWVGSLARKGGIFPRQGPP
ncbi:MAG: cell division protein FtsZ [Rhodospirillales bacterium]